MNLGLCWSKRISLCASERDDQIAAARRAIVKELALPRVDRNGFSTTAELMCGLRQRHGLTVSGWMLRESLAGLKRLGIITSGRQGYRLDPHTAKAKVGGV